MSVADFLAFQKRVFHAMLNPPECWVLLANRISGTLSTENQSNEAVALFDTKEQAETYIEVSKLPDIVRGIYVDNFKRSYRPDSTLWNFNPMLGAWMPAQRVRTRDVLTSYAHLPVNPAPPSRPIEEIIEELRAGVVAEALA